MFIGLTIYFYIISKTVMKNLNFFAGMMIDTYV